MATIRIYLDKRKPRQDGTCPLRLAINHHQDTAFITLGQYVNPAKWDARAQKAVGSAGRSLNVYLLNRLNIYTEALREVTASTDYSPNVSASELRDLLQRHLDPQEEHGPLFVDILKKIIETRTTNSTMRVYGALLANVQKFDPEVGGLALDDITRDWVYRFGVWLQKKGLSHNTRTEYISRLLSVYHYALDNELTTRYPFRRMKLRREATIKRNLSPDALRSVFEAKVKPVSQKWVDTFKLSFLLIGMNFSDMMGAKSTDVHNGRLEFHRRKTRRLYSIKIEPEAWAIIRKYSGGQHLLDLTPKGAVSRSAISCANNVLDRIIPGLTTYWARHSWATIAASLDIPKDTIAHALGHGGNTVTDVYIDFDMAKVDEANRRVIDWVLYGKR